MTDFVSDDVVSVSIKGLTDNTIFPANRAQHYARLLRFRHRPELFTCTPESLSAISTALDEFQNDSVKKDGEFLFDKWESDLKAGISTFRDEPQ